MTAPTTTLAVLAETHRAGHHRIEFAAPITREEFGAWLESRNWLGYHPAGYGGWWEVSGTAGTYVHSLSCD